MCSHLWPLLHNASQHQSRQTVDMNDLPLWDKKKRGLRKRKRFTFLTCDLLHPAGVSLNPIIVYFANQEEMDMWFGLLRENIEANGGTPMSPENYTRVRVSSSASPVVFWPLCVCVCSEVTHWISQKILWLQSWLIKQDGCVRVDVGESSGSLTAGSPWGFDTREWPWPHHGLNQTNPHICAGVKCWLYTHRWGISW